MPVSQPDRHKLVELVERNAKFGIGDQVEYEGLASPWEVTGYKVNTTDGTLTYIVKSRQNGRKKEVNEYVGKLSKWTGYGPDDETDDDPDVAGPDSFRPY